MRKNPPFTLTPAQVHRYLLHLQEQERAASTMQKYIHDLHVLMTYLDGAPLTKAALIDWKDALTAAYAPATVNAMLAAVLAEGTTLLENVAREPEVVDLARFLIRCGAEIEGHGSSVIRVRGVRALNGCEYAIMPDRIEAGTFLAAAGITGGELLLRNCPYDDMDAVLIKLREAGMDIIQRADGVLARPGSGGLRGVDVSTRPHPGFPTDMQAQLMALLCLADGSSMIDETIFENRFMHVQELVRMGADIRLSGSAAMVRGVEHLAGAPVMASDLRASASLVLAGLAARGKTVVQRIYHLDRGYERMEVKLQAVGARIRRVPADA